MQNIMKFENHPVRMWQDDKGELVIVAKDVAEALGYSESAISQVTNLFQSVPSEWKGLKPIKTLRRGQQGVLTLTEQGLYFFLGRSDKPAALPFQKWLAGEVLPSIRKTGGYGVPEKTTPWISPGSAAKKGSCLRRWTCMPRRQSTRLKPCWPRRSRGSSPSSRSCSRRSSSTRAATPLSVG